MANRKTSDLTALTAPVTGDLLPIVDISEAAAADKNKKITYGTFLSSVPLGTAAAPSIAFTGDNTGIYSPGADQLAIATGGTGRVFVDATGKVGIGTTSLGTTLAVNGNIGSNDRGTSFGYTLPDWRIYNSSSGGALVIDNYTTEALRVDSSNRLLVGTSSNSGGALLQVNGDRIRVGTAKTPATSGATGTTGEIAWDANYIYVCTATNTWKRSAIATW